MLIEIDVSMLADNGISADDYIAMYLLYLKQPQMLEGLKLKPNWSELQSKSFVKLGETVSEHVVRKEFSDLFQADFDGMFAELLSRYPMKVHTNTGSIRILHAADPNAKANEKSKNRYKKVVGNKVFKHRKIMDLLNKQLAIQRNSLGYMQNLEVWINNHTWEKFIDVEDPKQNNSGRITRKL